MDMIHELGRPFMFQDRRSRSKRLSGVIGGLATISLAVTLLAAPANATTAGTAKQEAKSSARTWEDAGKLPDETRDRLLQENREVLVSNSGLRFDTSRAEAMQADEMTLLRIPAAYGQGAIEPSALTVFLGADGNRISVIETAFFPRSETSGLAKFWTDGKLTFSQIVTDPADRKAPKAEVMTRSLQPLGGYVRGDWWGNFNQCLANSGVAGWAITALGIACAAVCLGTVGVACVPCLVAASGGTAATVSFCIRDASKYS